MSEPDTKTIPTRHGPMLALRGDQYVTRSLELYGEFSGLEQRLFEQLVEPGMTVVEVGANIGAHSVPLARSCAPGPLFVFEPQQRVFQILCANLALNGVTNVVAYPDASGAEPGWAMIPPINYAATGNFGGVSVQRPTAPSRGLPVRVTPVDSLKLRSCHLLKIDVEGFEVEVLQGARETIARCRPLLYVENDRAEHQQEVISLIDEMGYRQYWHTPPLFDPANPNGEQENAFPRLVSLNLLCVPKEVDRQILDVPPIDPKNWTCPVDLTPAKPTAVQAQQVTAAFAEMAKGDYASAERNLAAAVAANPSDHHAVHAYGALLSTLGRMAEAETLLRRALALAPNSPETRVGLGIVLLALGRHAEGWALYEARHDMKAGNPKPPLPYPEWKGEPLAGKVLHIWPDEGYGDQIQYARLIPGLQAQGADVQVICAPPLARLFAQSLEAPVHAASGQVDVPDPDYWVMFGSLLARTGVTAETAPKPPYLKALKARRLKGARIGVVTSGNPSHPNNLHRSLPPELAERLMALPEAVSLQPQDTGAKDFADTAAIVAGLDLVISVDTSVAHLAGAMDKSVWILLPALGTDWRWGLEGETTAWYPSARLWRQPAIGRWKPVVDAVVEAAAARMSS
jgi:FkbM family methyltransferase